MPTGYTAMLTEEKEITFEDFALKCARAFGALIEMRDESLDAKIPEEFKVTEYHTVELNRAIEKLNDVYKITIMDKIIE